ncbi:MAG: helix-turn-helix domain-containing protein [Deltaproteobacteria bacterium]|nr:helix-turn-helix domain-containing protein [Deltaproteobacteria bacterium]
MENMVENLSAAEIASICGVGHSTVRYWIRSGKLPAKRRGRNYEVPKEDLLFYLESSGYGIPDRLRSQDEPPTLPHFRPVQPCWEFFQRTIRDRGCPSCPVQMNRLEICFTVKRYNPAICSGHDCRRCRYYVETYLPRIQFIHQIDLPAAVYGDFFIYAANQKMLDLCGLSDAGDIGKGLEEVIDPEFLPTAISHAKRRMVDDPSLPRSYRVPIKESNHGRVEASVTMFPLNDPKGAFLILGEPAAGE